MGLHIIWSTRDVSTEVVGGYVNGVSTEPEESVCVGGGGGYEVITKPAISHWLGNCNFATGIIIKYQQLAPVHLVHTSSTTLK